MTKSKGLIRSLNRKGVRSGKVDTNRGSGRVLLRGAFVSANEDAIRRRIENVLKRSRSQSQSPKAAIQRNDEGLAIRTPSQQLAHRIVTEIGKAFHGEATLKWSDSDGSLLATWVRED